MGKFKLTGIDSRTVDLGVVKGTEVFDTESGQLLEVQRIDLDELHSAITVAREQGAAAERAAADAPTSRFVANDQRADSSPFAHERPAQTRSSEGNDPFAGPGTLDPDEIIDPDNQTPLPQPRPELDDAVAALLSDKDNTREALDALATGEGIKHPEELANKRAVAEAIVAARKA